MHNKLLDLPHNAITAIEYFKKAVAEVLGDNLVGLYVRGSIGMGCFNPKSSDIDLLLVIKKGLTDTQRQGLINKYNHYLTTRPYKVEFEVVKLDTLSNVQFPTQNELFLSGEDDSVETVFLDKGLPIGIEITKRYGIPVIGVSIDELNINVSKESYLKSVKYEVNKSLANVKNGSDQGRCEVPMYAVLNFCRTAAFVKDDLVVSKKDGGEWGLSNLPEVYKPVIKAAVDKYLTGSESALVDSKILKDFAFYIETLLPSN